MWSFLVETGLSEVSALLSLLDLVNQQRAYDGANRAAGGSEGHADSHNI